MGRKRTIDRDALMDGVESVARREGVSGLSIDALAKEVGISKSSVVYDCGSKAGLLAALLVTRSASIASVLAMPCRLMPGSRTPGCAR